MPKRVLVMIALVGTGTLMLAALAEPPAKTQNASEKLLDVTDGKNCFQSSIIEVPAGLYRLGDAIWARFANRE